MKIKTILSLLFIVACSMIYAQTEPIQADRPDQTETPAIVPKGMFQVETGFTFQKTHENSTSSSLPSVLWKYGVSGNFELRLITEFVSEKNFNKKSDGITPILVGIKIRLCEENGIVPKTSFIGHIGLPNAASSRYKNDFVAPEFRFTMQHTLSDKFSLGYNLGFEWDGMSPESTFIYTLTSGYAITRKIGCYAEIFGFAPEKDKASHNLDGGFTYLINDNFMVDLSSGFGITDTAPDYYVSLGCSFRI